MKPGFEIVKLKSGATSLRSLEHGETFHPGIGPLEEARILHVEQQRLAERAKKIGHLIIWDVGLGAAANAIAAISALKDLDAKIELHSFDKSRDPLAFALANAESLQYVLPYKEMIKSLLVNGFLELRPGFQWIFHEGDFSQTMKQPLPAPHCIFYDPYSPARNLDMWQLDHFIQLYKILNPEVPCLWTNYTRSTAVRVTLLLAGFYVGVGGIIGEKDETTVASNDLQLIKNPLGPQWLERVKNSKNAAPMQKNEYEQHHIGDADYLRLSAHEQFFDKNQFFLK